MALVKKEMDYAKELGDVGEALEFLVAEIKAKKPITEIVAGGFQKLMDAVSGVEQVKEELALNRDAAVRTLCYHVGGLANKLLG